MHGHWKEKRKEDFLGLTFIITFIQDWREKRNKYSHVKRERGG